LFVVQALSVSGVPNSQLHLFTGWVATLQAALFSLSVTVSEPHVSTWAKQVMPLWPCSPSTWLSSQPETSSGTDAAFWVQKFEHPA
jgi:hypothetical protein